MIKPEMIPDDVVGAAREAWLRSDVSAKEDWLVAIAAAINAWPESHWVGDFGLHLPIPSEVGEQKRLGPEFEAAIFSDVEGLYEADKPEGDA